MSNTNTNAVTITGSGRISAFIDGRMFTIDTDHPNYGILLDAVKNRLWSRFVHYADVAQQLNTYLSHGITIKDGVVNYNGEEIHNSLTRRIISFVQQDLPFEPLVKFLENLLQNPSKRAVDELYDFLEVGELPLTEDGHFLAFKNVKADYKDIHSGTFDNSVGSICEMPRWKVDEERDRTCSTGLHFCSIAYLPHFRDSSGGHTMIVKINPKDVVSIPADYNNTKGRCCRYEVVAEYTDDWRSKIDRGESGWDSDLYDENGNEYDDDGDDDDTTICEDCGTDLTHPDDDTENYLCRSCKDDEEDTQFVGNPDCDSPKCCGGSCHTDENQIGNQGNDHLDGGSKDSTTTNSSYHNVRDSKGRFTRKDRTILDALKNFFNNK